MAEKYRLRKKPTRKQEEAGEAKHGPKLCAFCGQRPAPGEEWFLQATGGAAIRILCGPVSFGRYTGQQRAQTYAHTRRARHTHSREHKQRAHAQHTTSSMTGQIADVKCRLNDHGLWSVTRFLQQYFDDTVDPTYLTYAHFCSKHNFERLLLRRPHTGVQVHTSIADAAPSDGALSAVRLDRRMGEDRTGEARRREERRREGVPAY